MWVLEIMSPKTDALPYSPKSSDTPFYGLGNKCSSATTKRWDGRENWPEPYALNGLV